MGKHIFKSIIVTKLSTGNLDHKVTLILDTLIPDTRKLLSHQKEIAERLAYDCGYFVGICQKSNIRITIVELILPQPGEYLGDVEKALKKEFLESNVAVEICIGKLFDIPTNRDFTKEDNISLSKKISLLKTNSGLN